MVAVDEGVFAPQGPARELFREVRPGQQAYTFSDLQRGSNYNIHVNAVSQDGERSGSSAVVCVATEDGLPDAVVGLRSDNIDEDSARIMFSPAFNGGSEYVRFVVRRSGVADAYITPSDASTYRYTLTNLQPETSYTVEVFA